MVQKMTDVEKIEVNIIPPHFYVSPPNYCPSVICFSIQFKFGVKLRHNSTLYTKNLVGYYVVVFCNTTQAVLKIDFSGIISYRSKI